MPAHGGCNGCGKDFGIFRKESSCQNCSLMFCSKCVENKAAVSRLNGKVCNVCIRCYNIISGKIKDAGQKRDISPPANFLRLQAAQSDKSTAPHPRRESLKQKGLTTDPMVKKHLKPEYRNLSKEDMEIAERLEKLKEDSRELLLGPNPLPPVQDIEQRLARLKAAPGESGVQAFSTPADAAAKGFPSTKPMTQQEETTNLLKQVRDEVNIDRRVAGDGVRGDSTNTTESTSADTGAEPTSVEGELNDIQSLIAQAAAELDMDAQKAIVELRKDKEIMAKLHRLKSRKSIDADAAPPPHEPGEEVRAAESSDEEDEEMEVKTLLQQVLEERQLDERVEAECGVIRPPLKKEKSLHLPLSEPEVDLDELPWCCICNEDATIRCIDCDMELYCRRCYKN